MILYEDDFIIAVNKPNNVLIHHSKMARNQAMEVSLVERLYELKQKVLYPIHRLDRKTSGIVLFAKEKEYVQDFQALFTSTIIEKTYYGIVRGFSPAKGIIDTPVKGRDALVHKEALTVFETLEKGTLPIAVPPFPESRYSLMKLLPKTGRMHQLRIHTNKISHPLIGDPKYGDRFHNRMFQTEFDKHHLFLHAASLAFLHPFLPKKLYLTCPFPSHWHTVLEKFNWQLPKS